MKPLDIFLAIGVAVIWGLGFMLTRVAVQEMSTTLLTLLRFAVSALPCLLLARPKLSWQVLVGISLLLVWQYLAQTYGIAHGVPAGLSAVIVQSQALFTIGFASILFKDRPTPVQLAGVAVSACGLFMICFTVGYDFSVATFLIAMSAPISFAFSNLAMRQVRDVPMLDLFAWISLVSVPPLAVAAWLAEEPAHMWQSLIHLSPLVMFSVLFLSLGSTTLGYWIWGRLLRSYSAVQVAPFALLIPFIGAAASSVVFGETFGSLRLAGMIVVVLGIAVMLLSRRPPALVEVA
jgi:O-acetylserine/cysteine efflux transporter